MTCIDIIMYLFSDDFIFFVLVLCHADLVVQCCDVFWHDETELLHLGTRVHLLMWNDVVLDLLEHRVFHVSLLLFGDDGGSKLGTDVFLYEIDFLLFFNYAQQRFINFFLTGLTVKIFNSFKVLATWFTNQTCILIN